MSSENLQIEYSRPPIVPLAFAKAALPKPGLKGGSIPRIEAHLNKVKVSRSALKKYRKICGFGDDGFLPITYPHILASGIHLGVMTRKEFPLRLLGLVHVRNSITQHRRLRADEVLNVKVHVEGQREVHNGVEFDLMTEVTDSSGNVAWEEVSTILSRGKSSGGKKKKAEAEATPAFTHSVSWKAPANIGRKYGVNAGDINPIHMGAVPAKLFGFPRAIAHGMWSLARCAAEMEGNMPAENVRLDIAFKLPVLLPASVELKYSVSEKGIDYRLTNMDGSKLHLSGQVSFLKG